MYVRDQWTTGEKQGGDTVTGYPEACACTTESVCHCQLLAHPWQKELATPREECQRAWLKGEAMFFINF